MYAQYVYSCVSSVCMLSMSVHVCFLLMYAQWSFQIFALYFLLYFIRLFISFFFFFILPGGRSYCVAQAGQELLILLSWLP